MINPHVSYPTPPVAVGSSLAAALPVHIYQRRARKAVVRKLAASFVLGLIASSLGSLFRFSEHQMGTSVLEYDRARDANADASAVYATMPFLRSNDACDNACLENEKTNTEIKKRTRTVPPSLRGDRILDFDPDAPVAIVTKIQGMDTIGALNQSLCLLTYAYNQRVNYDVVVFSATEISEAYLSPVRATIAPAKFVFVVDNPGIQAMVDELPEDQKKHLLDRCNTTNSSELKWTTRCEEKTSADTTLYRYMIWMNTDGFCTNVWNEDPIATLRRNDLVKLLDQFPGGTAKGLEWLPKIREAFGKNVCEISQKKDGTLFAREGTCQTKKHNLRQIYGFFHVTDLDFYRSDPVMKWQKIMVGDSKFSRLYDDQSAVTIPAAILAGNRSWQMRYYGLNLSVLHNSRTDGREYTGPFKRFWRLHGKKRFPEAYEKCSIVSNG